MDTTANNSHATAAASRSNLQNGLSVQEDRMNAANNIPEENAQRQRPNEINERFSSSDSADELREDLNWSASGHDLSTSKPKSEAHEVDERDRYSPLRYPLSLPIQSLHNDDMSNIVAGNGIPVARRSFDSSRISSKEEKQRQNEEKKTPASTSNTDAPLSTFGVESSSVSSETGSWEAIYPPRKSKPTNYSDQTPEQTTTRPSTAGERNCFIDASTLLDDGDIAFTSTFKTNPTNNNAITGDAYPCATTSYEPNIGDQVLGKLNIDTHNDRAIETNTQHIYGDNMEVKKSRENLAEDFDRDEAEAGALVINLSDEQKLSTQKSFEMGSHRPDIKDQYSTECITTNGPKPVSLNMLNEYSARGDCVKNGSDRQENERKQGHFLFSNSIQQFSGHTMTPKIPYLEENQSDFSLPSIYSGGSDCASTFDTSSHISSDRDSHDFAELSNFSIGNSSKGESVIYPDTPHNSILHVNLSRNSLGPSDSAIASLSSSESNVISIPPRRSHDDTVPILSGGASVKDFTPKQCDSPSMQRKTENCPIISVGMSALDFEEKKPKPRERQSSLAMNSWVVDMSDCGKQNRRRGSESSSVSVESNRYSDCKPDRSGSSSSSKGFGYYVSLNDMKPSYAADEHLSKSLNYHSSSSSCASAEPRKKSTGFFVDFSNNDSGATNTPPPNEHSEQAHKNDDKKNIFSMFIDFGNDEQRSTPKRDIHAKLSSNGKGNDTISTESPVLSRRNQPFNSQQSLDGEKRHSWNASKEAPHLAHVREHKRSISTSSDKGIMNILDKIPLISKTSSMSIDTPNSPHDDITSKSLSSYSNNSLTSLSVQSSGSKFNEHDDKATGKRHHRINETFDKSSQGSLTDDILSKNSTSTSNTDTDDATFHNDNDDTLHGDISTSNVMETIPETKEAVVLRRHQNGTNSKMERHTMESLQATIEKQKQLLNTVSEEVSSFVKLSDMDKPAPKFELHNSESRPKSVGSRIGKLFDNRAGNRNTWHHMSKSAGNLIEREINICHFMFGNLILIDIFSGNNLTNLASSAENFKSLTRIFPHLGKDLSNSLPTNFDQSTSNTSPNEYTMDLFNSDFSTSSATSSVSRSGIGMIRYCISIYSNANLFHLKICL